MSDDGYGLWLLVVFNSVLFIVFAVSFFHPKSGRDWRVLGGFSAFVVALDLIHNAGHLWSGEARDGYAAISRRFVTRLTPRLASNP